MRKQTTEKSKKGKMKRESVSLFIVLCVIKVLDASNKEEKGTCNIFNGIEREALSEIKTSVKENQMRTFMIQNKVVVWIMQRKVYNAYCYHGSAIDPNTGCFKSTKIMNPSPEEAKSWMTSEKCFIGDDCGIDQESCKGDGASKCLSNELTKWVERKNIEEGGWWMRFPWHTCYKSWGCSIEKSIVTPVITVSKGGPRVELNIGNNWVVVSEKGESKNYHILDDVNKVLIVEPFLAFSGNSTGKCLERNNKRECLILNKISGNKEIIEMSQKRWSVGRTIAISNNEMTSIDSVDEQRENIYRAASLNDFKRLIMSMHYTQMEVDTNFEAVNFNFLKMSNLLIGVVEYITKKDDTAYSQIMEVSDIMKWISPNEVMVCKPLFPTVQAIPDCRERRKYMGGSYHETSKDQCKNVSKPLHSFRMMDKYKILNDSTYIEVNDIGTTSSEIINRKLFEDRIKEMESTIKIKERSGANGMDASLPVLGYLNPSKWFSIISSYISLINTGLIIILFLRK